MAKGCFQNIDAIDFGDGGDADPDLGFFAELFVNVFAHLTLELFGIVQPLDHSFDDESAVQNHGTGNHGSGPGTATGFVHAANDQGTALHGLFFEEEIGHDRLDVNGSEKPSGNFPGLLNMVRSNVN